MKNHVFLFGILTMFSVASLCLSVIACNDDDDDKGSKSNDPAVIDGFCPDNKHPHAIDLGLDVKFSCCNVGASSPWEYGGYYAWGETKTKNNYDDSTYKYFDNEAHDNGEDAGDCYKDIGTDIAGTSYDVAHVEWGKKWRMPNLAQLQLLIENCTSEWTKLNDVNGLKFTGPNGKAIFMPAAGEFKGKDIEYKINYGGYWSSTSLYATSILAHSLGFSNSAWCGTDERYLGKSVRPVTE